MEEELFAKVKERMEANTLPLSRFEEQRMELMMIGYRGDIHIRAWLVLAMDVYARAVMEQKVDIFVDGFILLRKMLFEEEGR